MDAKETYIDTKETHIDTKEAYIDAKHILTGIPGVCKCQMRANSM